MAHLLIFFNMLVYFTYISFVNSQHPKVNTKLGEIIGNEITVQLELSNNKVHQYLGIPFAKPPLGKLRFRKPEPVTSLPSPFYAQNFSAICPQRPLFDELFNEQKGNQSEDCLYLNVYVPDQGPDIPRGHSVMIWIYGGGFQEGAGSHYDFSALSVVGNIIVVSFNYRLGVFGFLNSINEDASGNYGLWDQHLAFHWVHDNIRDFGGDNKRVTIAGESAGAMSAIQHALVPANRGLFQRLIAQSGSMSIPAMDLGRDRNKDVHILAKTVGCSTDFLFDILECLRAKSVEELLAPSLTFNPTLDGELIKVNTRDISKISETKLLDEVEFVRSLDILSGFNANEGIGVLSTVMHFLPTELQSSHLGNLTVNKYHFKNHYIPAVMNFTFQKQFADEIIKLVEAQYTPWTSPDDHHLLRLKFEKLVGDLNFAVPAIQMARLHAMSSSANNFMYHFAPKPSIRALPTPSWIPGAAHADEIMFMLGTFGRLGVGKENDWENDLIRKMITYWTNFVKSGDPNLPKPVSPFWTRYSFVNGEYLLLNKSMTNMSETKYFYAEEVNFWLNVFPDLVKVVQANSTDKISTDLVDVVATNLADLVPVDLVNIVDEGEKDICGNGNFSKNSPSSANGLLYKWTVTVLLLVCVWTVLKF